MDLINKALNVVLPSLVFLSLFFLSPLLIFFKLLRRVQRRINAEDVAGKVIIITGSSSGIGEQLAYEYARRGARLTLVARREDLLQAVAEKSRRLGSTDVVAIRGDVCVAEDCKRFVDETIDHFGQFMESINKMMNFVFPPLALYGLSVFYPTYQRLKSIVSICRNLFAEDVAGKVVLITGAASGIGECVAYEYAKRGAYLALVDIRGDPLYNVAALAEIYGSPQVIPVVSDVSKVEDCERFIRATVLHFGRLDHLVTNAGVAPLYLFEDIDDLSNAAPAMDINFWGSAYCTFFACPHLKESRGRIVVIASGCGYIPSPRLSFYCASKAAVISFYETLRIEFGSEIGITIIAPGIIDSELSRGKFMTKDGELKVDKELRDIQINVLPVESAETCAKAIIRSVCRGDRYLVEPSWIDSVILWRVFAPEVTEWLGRWWTGLGNDQAASKKILELVRVMERFLFQP